MVNKLSQTGKSNKVLLLVILFQFAAYSANAGFQPFRVVFLSDHGISNSLIGIILTVSSLVAIIVQPMWGILSDRLKSIKKVFILCLLFCMLLTPLLTVVHGFVGYLIIMTLVSVFMCPFLPFMDMWTVQGLKIIPGNHTYGSVRLWGSVGFTIVVALLGRLALVKSVDAVLITYSLMNIVTIIIALSIPFEGTPPKPVGAVMQAQEAGEKKPDKKANKLQIGRLMKNYYYITFVLAACFVNVSMMVKMTYLPERMSFAGGDTQLYSLLMSIGAISEVPMLFLSKYILRRFKPINMIIVSMGLSILHIFLLSMNIPAWGIMVIHVLQGFSFGLTVIGNVYYVDSLAPNDLKASAQSIFSSASFGMAGMLGSSIGGILLDRIGILETYLMCAVFSVFAFAVFIVSLLFGKVKNIPHIQEGQAEEDPV